MMLARLLHPSDFGVMAVAGAAYAIVTMLMDLGLSSALIHFQQPSRGALSSLYWLNLACSFAMAMAMAGAAYPVAALYGQADLAPVFLAMSLALPISACGSQFKVLAEKDLRFASISIIEVVATIAAAIGALSVAAAGGGVFSFVAAILLSSAISTTLSWAFLSTGVRPAVHFCFAEIAPFVRYGIYRLGDALANNLTNQADLLIGGAVASPFAMGFYTTTRDLSLRLANTVVNPVITRIGLPVMARVQSDASSLKAVYLQTLRMTASINFPIYIALAVWADEMVEVLLGKQWAGASAYLQIFAMWGLIRSTGNPVGSLLYACGHVRRAFWWNIAFLVILPSILFMAVALDGLNGLAIGMLATQALAFYPAYRLLVYPACGARFTEYIRELAPPLAAAVIAVGLGHEASALLCRASIPRLAIGGTVAIAAYLGISLVINRTWLTTMQELIKPFAGRPR